MAYIRTKIINGRAYRYLQTSYRVGKKVKTKCRYLGRAGGERSGDWFVPHIAEDLDQGLVKAKEHKAEREAHLDKLHQEFGLKLGPSDPVPEEKISSRSTDEGGPA
jgi:hypothetical protein